MLHTLSWFFYFLLCLFLGIFLFLSPGNSDIMVGKEIVFLFTVLLLPALDSIFQMLGKERIFQSDIFDFEKYLMHYIIVGGVLFTFWYGGYSLVSLIFWGIFLFGVLFQLNPKIVFIAALIVFIYIPFFLMLGDKNIAEELSVYAYYFLILGVVFQIAESVAPKIAKLGK